MAGRIRNFGEMLAALEALGPRASASGLRGTLLRYDGRDLAGTARWQHFIGTTPFARTWRRKCAPYATTLAETDALRVRLLYWRPGLVMPFHDHPDYALVGLSVLGGSPLQEHVRCRVGDGPGGRSVDGTFRRELAPGDASVIPGTGAEHRVRVKYSDMSTYTLSVELGHGEASDEK